MRRVTSGEFDVIRVLHIDEKAGRVYFLASPENPTQQYLYRAALDGSGTPERLTPGRPAGLARLRHLARRGAGGPHATPRSASRRGVELVSLPDHKVVRTLAANDKLREAVAASWRRRRSSSSGPTSAAACSWTAG